MARLGAPRRRVRDARPEFMTCGSGSHDVTRHEEHFSGGVVKTLQTSCRLTREQLEIADSSMGTSVLPEDRVFGTNVSLDLVNRSGRRTCQ